MVQSNVRPVPGLSPRRIALGNGAVFIGKHARATPAVTINLAMRAGSMYDPAEGVGATWLLSRVIDRGTASRSTADIAADLDARGVTVTVSVTLHILSLVCTCLAEDFEPVFSLLGEMLMRPSLPEHEIVTCKGEVITAIRQDQDNPAARSTELLMALLYPGSHPVRPAHERRYRRCREPDPRTAGAPAHRSLCAGRAHGCCRRRRRGEPGTGSGRAGVRRVAGAAPAADRAGGARTGERPAASSSSR